MIQKEERIINNKKVYLYFDTEKEAYLVSKEGMEAIIGYLEVGMYISEKKEKTPCFLQKVFGRKNRPERLVK